MTTTIGNRFKIQVTASSTGPWTPPYPLPQGNGGVVGIGADAPSTAELSTGVRAIDGAAISRWPTNTAGDVRPGEFGAGNWENNALAGGDAGWGFVASYSQGGFAVQASSGGHQGFMNLGACGFDFEDGRFKRIWTGGVSFDSGWLTPSSTPPYIDVRMGTKVHNCVHEVTDLFYGYTSTNNGVPYTGSNGIDSDNDLEWTPTAQDLQYAARTADPRNQVWELSSEEPAAWNATTNPHGWRYPGQWANLQGQLSGGYIGGNMRYAAAEKGLVGTSHTWDLQFEVSPANGGGPKGTLCICRHTYMGIKSNTGCTISNGINLSTGRWSAISTNKSDGGTIAGQPPVSTGAGGMTNAISSAYDEVKNRVWLMSGLKATGSGAEGRLNYMNLADKTWRGIITARNDPYGASGRSETLACDPVRRLLIMQGAVATGTNNSIRMLDLSDSSMIGESIGNAVGTPTQSRTGWRPVPLTVVAGFEDGWNGIETWDGVGTATNGVIAVRGGARDFYQGRWVYYPPNGNFYRVRDRHPVWRQSLGSLTMYARVASPYLGVAIGDSAPPAGQPQGIFRVLQRLRPPAIIVNPPTDYYWTNPWFYDEITLSTPMPRAESGSTWSAVGATRRFFYIPAIQCLAWIPLSSYGLTIRNGVYLIKPY